MSFGRVVRQQAELLHATALPLPLRLPGQRLVRVAGGPAGRSLRPARRRADRPGGRHRPGRPRRAIPARRLGGAGRRRMGAALVAEPQPGGARRAAGRRWPRRDGNRAHGAHALRRAGRRGPPRAPGERPAGGSVGRAAERGDDGPAGRAGHAGAVADTASTASRSSAWASHASTRPTRATSARWPAAWAGVRGRWPSTDCGYDRSDDVVAAPHVAARASARLDRRLSVQAVPAVPHLYPQTAGDHPRRGNRPGARRRAVRPVDHPRRRRGRGRRPSPALGLAVLRRADGPHRLRAGQRRRHRRAHRVGRGRQPRRGPRRRTPPPRRARRRRRPAHDGGPRGGRVPDDGRPGHLHHAARQGRASRRPAGRHHPRGPTGGHRRHRRHHRRGLSRLSRALPPRSAPVVGPRRRAVSRVGARLCAPDDGRHRDRRRRRRR